MRKRTSKAARPSNRPSKINSTIGIKRQSKDESNDPFVSKFSEARHTFGKSIDEKEAKEFIENVDEKRERISCNRS